MSYRDVSINGSIVLGRKLRDREEFANKYSGVLGRELNHKLSVCIDFLRPHVILVCGKKGYGKSYTLGVLAEEFLSLDSEVRNNLSVVVVDPMGIFWSMKMGNIDSVESRSLSEEWGLEKYGFSKEIRVMIPAKFEMNYKKQGWMYDEGFLLNPGELEDTDWCYAFDVDGNSPMGLALSLVISNLKEKLGNNYLIRHIISEIKNMPQSEASQQTKLALTRRFASFNQWGIFVDEKDVPTRIFDIVKPGKVTVLNLSDIREDLQGGWGVRTLVLGLLARKIFEFRIEGRRDELSTTYRPKENRILDEKEPFPMVWMLIDEAHRFAPNDRNTAASLPLKNWARMGRQPGLSLVLSTQRPGNLDMDVLSQCDLILCHRLTAQVDIDALNRIRPTFSAGNILEHVDALPHDRAGFALAIDDVTETVVPFQVRPRKSWHSGEDAIAKKPDVSSEARKSTDEH